jgi:hypothetical protein
MSAAGRGREMLQKLEAYASSSVSFCGMAATIAGQATMTTNARATRMSCIADSLKEISNPNPVSVKRLENANRGVTLEP